VLPQDAPSNARLDSWKEIAAFLKRDVTTVRRWEKREGLPVHRHLHDRRDSVYAYAIELDEWLGGRRNGGAISTETTLSSASRLGRRAVIAIAAVSIFVVSGSLVAIEYLRKAPVEASAVRLPFSIPHPLILADAATGGQFSISPDSRRLIFVAAAPDGTQGLWIRPLDSLTAEPLPGTDGAAYPFWSPDGRVVAFFAQRKLKKIAAAGGPVQTLADAVLPTGGTWNQAGVIIFAANAGEQLYRVSAAGGPVTRVTLDQPNRESHWPDFLPDGQHFVYHGRREKTGIYLGSIDSPETKLLATGYVAADYAAPGYLLLLTGGTQSQTLGTLMAQRFDTSRFQLVGEAVSLAESVGIRPQFSRGVFSTSENGTVLYGTSRHQITQLVLLDRNGTQVGTITNPGRYERMALSPDEQTVAVELTDPHVETQDIWLIDTVRGVTSRFTSDSGAERMPVWSPDGTRIIFSSPRDGNPPSLFEKMSNGGSERAFFRSDLLIQPTDWSRDGRFIVYGRRDSRTQWDLWVVPASSDPQRGGPKPEIYLQTPFNEHHGHLSADGRWMAYASDESGKSEVYVRAFPPLGARWQISTDGGVEPRWRRDGKELFYVSPDGALMAATLQFDEMKVQPDAPRALFKARFAAFGAGDMWRPVYVPVDEGGRFLVNVVVEETVPSPVTMLLNWPAALKRR
jgi:eukaryotic-like serine/threonine-protein kinase